MPKKYALLVGINEYCKPEYNLKYCVNDVLDIREQLLKRGFGLDDIRVLCNERATIPAIRNRLRWLNAVACPNDWVNIHFSMHGSQIVDRDGDELNDHFDECLVTHEMNWERPFTDDIFSEYLKAFHPKVNVLITMDTCHSGGMKRSLKDLFFYSKDQKRFIMPPFDIFCRARTSDFVLPARKIHYFGDFSCQNHIVLSACQENEQAGEALFNFRGNGAFTSAWVEWLAGNPKGGKIGDAFDYINKRVQKLFNQHPQIDCPEEFLNIIF